MRIVDENMDQLLAFPPIGSINRLSPFTPIYIRLRVMEINNSTIWRRMWVRRQGASTGAYRDMCRRMEQVTEPQASKM
jgi:hypothetical protein